MFRALFLALAVLTATAPASLSEPYSIYKIVHRAGSGADDGFRDYPEANSVEATFIFRDMEDHRSRLPGHIEEIKALTPDLIYTQTISVTRAVVGRLEKVDPANHVLDIPVVFSMVSFPARSKLVPSNPDPAAPVLSKRSLTGARHVVSNLVRLNAMRTFMPFEKIGVLYDKSSGAQRRSEAAMRALAEEAGIEFVSDSPTEPKVERDPAQIEPALRRLKEAEVDFLYIPPSNFFGAQAELVTRTATDLGLRAFCSVETLIRQHCMTGLVSPFYAVGQFAAFKAEQILVGVKDPGEIPIETLSRFSFAVNMETAHKLKVYSPTEILRFAQFIKTGTDS